MTGKTKIKIYLLKIQYSLLNFIGDITKNKAVLQRKIFIGSLIVALLATAGCRTRKNRGTCHLLYIPKPVNYEMCDNTHDIDPPR